MSNVHFQGQRSSSNISKISESTRLLHAATTTAKTDSAFGFEQVTSGEKIGWLSNIHPTLIPDIDPETGDIKSLNGVSGVDLYWLDLEGGYYKTTKLFKPYMFILVNENSNNNNININGDDDGERLFNLIEQWIKKEINGVLETKIVDREDLALANHLVGLKRRMIKITFGSELEMNQARFRLNRTIQYNKDIFAENGQIESDNCEDFIMDLREFDVPFHTRVMIDLDLRVGKWYCYKDDEYSFYKERETFPDPVVLAFDIETCKAPLKFPDSNVDAIMMISYMIDGEGFLITNREVISKDIDDFEYTPKPELKGDFTIFNEPDEKAMILKFFEHIQDVQPTIISTFNGDFFDWPFLDKRATVNGLSMFDEIGWHHDEATDTYQSSYCCHMDCFQWVTRDSYLPQGSRGLKAVTRLKLGYDPLELDPELMTPYARDQPQKLSEYSVSDAVATYYLYMKYVHPFIFSLCTIIPLNPDETLRKGTGTLCEMLLMVEAYNNNIVLPNKHKMPIEKFYDGHLLQNETYSGGKVLSVESGVFRSDLQYQFNIEPEIIKEFIPNVDKVIEFFVTVECGKKMDSVLNADEVKQEIVKQLQELIDNPKRFEKPLLYHVDVASMYPNIMITNRLQPDSMKTEHDCAKCDYNSIGKKCDRRLEWKWRGEYFPADHEDYGMIKRQLQQETFNLKTRGKEYEGTWDDLTHDQQVAETRKRLKEYSQKSYKTSKTTKETVRESIVCQRENPFYADTVRSFRDRRYFFKREAQKYFREYKELPSSEKHLKEETLKKQVLNDSLQLAHKVILNSFYGYVMRKGSRWFSMEMAGITCYTGSKIITMANGVVSKIGRPLELDTDGIWCILPSSFPEDFKIDIGTEKKLTMPFIGSLLNERVHKIFTNDQYHNLNGEITRENSILFEVDGPYKAMILPSSEKKGEGIKKRYAVFDEKDKLVELKGFELKRRGELQLVKNFQNDLFKMFLKGDTLEACYKEVAKVADRWLDVIYNKGANLEDEDLIELICENKSMSRPLDDYGTQKSTSITTAKRLGEFLGKEMIKDKGLQVKYIIADRPKGATTTERAIPVAIFSHEDSNTKVHFLQKWLKDNRMTSYDPRDIIDWEYYKERLGSTIKKIITIPAALQKIPNPVPRVEHPDWLRKEVNDRKYKQTNVTDFFSSLKPKKSEVDIEDIGSSRQDLMKTRKRKLEIDEGKKLTFENEGEKANKFEDTQFSVKTCPNPKTSYTSFLAYNKKMWEQQAKQRMSRNSVFGNRNQKQGNNSRKVTTLSQSFNEWQVLSYKEDPQDRDVTIAMLSTGDKLINVKIKTPKMFYICSDEDELQVDDSLVTITKSNKIASSDEKQRKKVFECTTPHSHYDELVNDVHSFIHKYVLLENEISSVDRLIMRLGNLIKTVDLKTVNNGLKHGFDLKDLDSVEVGSISDRSGAATTNIGNILPNANLINLSIVKTVLGYTTFSIMSFDKLTNEDLVSIFVLKPSETSNPLNSKNLSDKFGYGMSVSIEQLANKKKFYNMINKQLTELILENQSNVIFMLNDGEISSYLTSIKDKYPLITTANVNKPIKVALQNWNKKLTNNIYKHFSVYKEQYKSLVDISTLNKIPVANLGNEIRVIDYKFGERLMKQNHILDWSLSGKNKKDGVSNFQNIINHKGVYPQVTVLIKIKNQLINSILTSNLLLTEMDLSTQEDITPITISKMAILRQLVKELYNSKHNYSLLNLLEPWLYSKNSALTGESLIKLLSQLLSKSKNVLRKQISKDCKIIYSAEGDEEEDSVLISLENRFDLKNSITFSNYILDNLALQNPLLTYISPIPVRIYDLLIFKDMNNFMGRYLKHDDINNRSIRNDNELEYVLDSKWIVKKSLPLIYKKEFDDWMLIMFDCLLKRKNENFNDLTGYTKFFAKDLYKRIERLWQKQTENIIQPDLSSQFDIVKLPGLTSTKNKTITNPLVLFVSLLNEVLTLNVDDLEGRKMRKLLLSIFDIKEFSSDGQPPVLQTCHIGDVICGNCFQFQRITNKSIIKDAEDIIDKSHNNSKNDKSIVCTDCHKPFERDVIMNLLLQKAINIVNNYNTQDIKCNKCGSIKEDLMSLNCDCSGFYTLVSESVHLEMKLLADCSEYMNLNLKNVLERML
ncbi:hypothetical protein ACO0SA_002543 [Hanseniaspora valbyensis]